MLFAEDMEGNGMLFYIMAILALALLWMAWMLPSERWMFAILAILSFIAGTGFAPEWLSIF